jgi:transcriptional regulator GlxA family with amidase domain
MGSEMDRAREGTRPEGRLIGIVLFDEFETLDVFGPVQMWGRLPDHRLTFLSFDGRPVRSSQGTLVHPDHALSSAPRLDVMMVPGGMGTRPLLQDKAFLDALRTRDSETSWTASVCTGAALLAKAGLLDGRAATTNKLAFDWVRDQRPEVDWRGRARWVFDGKFLTSSGVSAGTDMALALVERLYGRKAAEEAAQTAEYLWNDDSGNDPFAVS